MPVSLRTFHSSFPFHPLHTLRWEKTQPLKFLLAFCEEKCPWVKVFFLVGAPERVPYFLILLEAFELHIGLDPTHVSRFSPLSSGDWE